MKIGNGTAGRNQRIAGGAEILREPHVQDGQQVLQLPHALWPDDGGGDAGLVLDPQDGQLGGVITGLTGQLSGCPLALGVTRSA